MPKQVGVCVPFSTEAIEQAIVREGGLMAAARALGISPSTANRRLAARYGSNRAGNHARCAELLNRLIDTFGDEWVAQRLGTDAASVRYWRQTRVLASAVRRAVVRLAAEALEKPEAYEDNDADDCAPVGADCPSKYAAYRQCGSRISPPQS